MLVRHHPGASSAALGFDSDHPGATHHPSKEGKRGNVLPAQFPSLEGCPKGGVVSDEARSVDEAPGWCPWRGGPKHGGGVFGPNAEVVPLKGN